MATKNNPGAWDCYSKAEPDEEMFILLGRDEDAPALVALWAALRAARKHDPDKIAEARSCAERIRAQVIARGKTPTNMAVVADIATELAFQGTGQT